MYTSKEIQNALNVVIHLDTLIEQGQREGWGYESLSTARVIYYLTNEKKLIEEQERRKNDI